MIFYVAVFVFYAEFNSIFVKVVIVVKCTVRGSVPGSPGLSNVRFIENVIDKVWKEGWIIGMLKETGDCVKKTWWIRLIKSTLNMSEYFR